MKKKIVLKANKTCSTNRKGIYPILFGNGIQAMVFDDIFVIKNYMETSWATSRKIKRITTGT